jgi:hypothetical protein
MFEIEYMENNVVFLNILSRIIISDWEISDSYPQRKTVKCRSFTKLSHLVPRPVFYLESKEVHGYASLRIGRGKFGLLNPSE